MDLLYGLVGGFVLTWLGSLVIKQVWIAAVVAAVVTIVILGVLPAGFQPLSVLTTVVGAVVGAVVSQKMKKGQA